MVSRMRIRLTRKLSQRLNGVDISRQSVGDVVDLPRHDAELLLAEGWALPATDSHFEASLSSQGGNTKQRTGKRRE